MKKRLLAAILATVMLIALLPTPTYAASQMGYQPYANVEYGYSSSVSVGTIRYIAQNSASAYFYSSYWPSYTFGGYAGASSECGTACISMALSYVGVDRTPKVLLESTNGYTGEMWGTQGDATSSSIGISKAAIATAMNNYINGNGKYSPLCIYIQPWSSTSSMHWVLLIGKISENTYLALNPWHTAGTNATLTMVINGTTATYNGTTNPITSVNQWYNPKAVNDLNNGTSRLKIEPTTIPSGNLTPGAAFSLQGTVSSNYKITYFEGSIMKSSGAVQQSVSINPNAYTVDIRSSDVNQNLVFNSYPNGKYKLHYYAEDASSNKVSWDSDWFWIGDTVAENYYLDVNGWLDGEAKSSTLQYGTFDVYVNGSPAADDVNDYYTQWPEGTAYSINDIRPAAGYSYDGVYSGNRTGTVSSDPTNVVLSFSTIDVSSITETPSQEVYNGHTYLYYQTPVTWYFAEEFCESMGGHLVCVTSSAENEFVKGLISGNRAWLGATDIDSEGTWRWVSGEQFSYSDWDSEEPNNSTAGYNSSEDYAHYNPNKWNDTTGCLTLGFVCEIDYACDHVYNYVVTKEPSKSEAGVLTGYCSLCDETITITLPKLASTNYTQTIIPGTCATRPIERYEWNTKTYGIFSFDVVMGDDYSEWSTVYPTGIDESLIESRTEYRYSDYETTTSYNTSTSMSGWTPKSSEWKQSGAGTINYVSSWPSGFSTSHSLYSQYNNSPKSASETATDKTVINSTGTAGWIYYHWCRGTYAGGPINRATSPYYTSEFNSFHAFFSTTNPNTLTASGDGDGSYTYANSSCCTDSHWYYPVTVSSQSYTTYKKLFTYERWTDWSDWGTTPYTESSTRKVETRTVYRYITTPIGDHTWNDGEITSPATCTEDGAKTYTCSVCGETKAEAIEMLGHDYQTVVTAPTCTEQGYTTHTCSRCGATFVDTTTGAAGHNIVNDVCTVCGLQVPTVTIASVSGAPGDTVSVPVTISNNGGFAGFTFTFTADDALSITKIAKGELLQSADSGSFTTNVSGGVATWFDSVNSTGDGTLMVLTVKINDNAQEGQYQIQAALKDGNETNFVDENSQAIPISFAKGTITVAPTPLEIKLTISGDPISTAPGNTITVPVMISGGANLAGFTLTVNASEGLTLTKVEKGALLKNADGMFTANVSQKVVNWTSSTNVAGEGELMLLTFDVCETVSDDSTLTITLGLKDNKISNFADEDENPVGVKFEDITVTVESIIFGDVNSDGDVDTIDSIRLVRYLVDLVDLTPAQRKAADVNHDEDITTTDAIHLAKYLVGLVDALKRSPTKGIARTAGNATVSVGTVSCASGDTVKVPVSISNNPGYAGFTLTITGADGLTLTNIEKGELLKNADGMFTKNVAQNRINWTSSENVEGNGELMILTFAVSSDAISGEYPITISLKDGKTSNFANVDEVPVSVTFTAGAVKVNNGEEATVTITVGESSCKSGETVTVPVSIFDNPGFAGFTFTITGTEGLTLKNIAKGELLQDADGMFTKNVAQSRINWTSSENVVGDGELIVLTFEVSSEATLGDYAVSISLKDGKASNFANVDETPIAVTFEPGKITVPDHEHEYTDVVTPPTCTEQGYTTHTCLCGDSYVDSYVPAPGHNWNTPTYTWAVDNSTVTATRTCKNDASHVETETVKTTSEAIKEATVDEEGEVKYTATFENEAFETQIKTVVTPKLDDSGDELPCDGGDSCPGKIFTDMPAKGHWAHDAIDWAIVHGITAGTSATTFSPNAGCTRAQVVTFLWRAAGKPEPTTMNNPFKDIKEGTYYYKAVLWAAETGVTAGTSATTFSPDATCTRGQIVTFIWRYEGKPEATITSNLFNDVKAGAYYEKAVLWASETGVTAGTSATTFSPESTCTRAQIVTFLYRDLAK